MYSCIHKNKVFSIPEEVADQGKLATFLATIARNEGPPSRLSSGCLGLSALLFGLHGSLSPKKKGR
jgi:hypothetical protein